MKSFLKGILWLITSLFIILAILVGIAFYVFDSDNLKSRAISMVKEQTSADLTIEEDLSLNFFPWLEVETGKIKLSNPDGFNRDKNLLSVNELKASIKLMPLLKGQIEIGAIELTDSELNLLRDKQGRSNLDVLITNSQKTQPSTENKTVESETSLSVSRIGLDSFVLNQYNPNGKLTQSFSLNQFDLNQFAFDQWTPISASGEFISGSGKTEANWQLNSEVNVATGGQEISLRQTSAVMDNMGNKLNRLELAGDTKVSLNNENSKISHEGSLLADGQKFVMELNAIFSTFKDIQLNLKAEDLNLTPLLASDNKGAGEGSAPFDGKPIADFLKRARIKGTFAADTITFNKTKLSNVQANLSNKGTTLWLKPFKASAFQGGISSDASINFASSPLALSISPRMQKIQVGDLISEMFELEKLTGLGDLDLDLSTRGIEFKQMLKNLSGTGAINLSDGALSGWDLNKIIESGINLQTLTTANSFKGKTSFAGLKSDLKADKGLIQLNNIALVTPLFDLVGAASTNANKESLAGNFQLVLKGALKDQLEKKYPQLAGVDLPFELKGTWTEPRPSIDFESMLKAKYKSQIDKEIDDKKKELEDEIKKKLLDKLKFD
ncbi:AsmA family protein [Kangiella sp. HZ709]|uniref:AsmA family protein n=1 Tax=Kangiella sp. HZ709 TaxID=2666328 RepID=UPI0012AF9DE4|nr:AsmA family protein [Kangiella sp. HZ709]MRX28670.1 AsmA family protein [Kangiella sp. HZ709]